MRWQRKVGQKARDRKIRQSKFYEYTPDKIKPLEEKKETYNENVYKEIQVQHQKTTKREYGTLQEYIWKPRVN